MKIAVEGCAHGELDKIYEAIEILEKENNVKVDLLIICGDFQAVRNPADLNCMAVPPKYRKLNTFYKYYSGAKKAPILTIFVGGNHEASNYLSELSYGGWVCPNIYYLGYASVININGIRIGGLSGIYKGYDYLKGHFEFPPYDKSTIKTAYHVRNVDVFRLKQIQKPIDIFISHDWPTGVYNYGDKEALLKTKSFFRNEMSNNSLGSQPAEELLMKLKPSYWFAAHLHCKFAALVPHNENGSKTFTKFLALDKCLPRRKFLQIIDIDSNPGPAQIEYDLEWLSILCSTNHLLSVSRKNNYMPGQGCSERWNFTPTEEELAAVAELFNTNLKVPDNFAVTAPIYEQTGQNYEKIPLKSYPNPQTETFCKILNLTDPYVSALNSSSTSISIGEFSGSTEFDQSRSSLSAVNPDEILLSDDDLTDEIDTSQADLDASGGSDFFIDKTGSNFSSSKKCSTPKLQNIDLSFPEIKEENLVANEPETDDAAAPASENPLKKFKRRNWALYKSEDDNLT